MSTQRACSACKREKDRDRFRVLPSGNLARKCLNCEAHFNVVARSAENAHWLTDDEKTSKAMLARKF
ncbi:MAG: hypothetical protein JKY67_08420 [Pseudomonadales bacterium]|nr:hypothetical protein [Pseudomonadales bacterium]